MIDTAGRSVLLWLAFVTLMRPTSRKLVGTSESMRLMRLMRMSSAVLLTIGIARLAVPSTAHTTTRTGQVGDAVTEEHVPYVLQIGDEIEIKAFQLPEIENTVRIGPDGKISLILVDEVEAVGLTTAQLDELLTRAYSVYFRHPQITVIVREFANLSVYVAGEVGRPGVIALKGQLTALGAVIRSGGFRPSAKTNSVILLRKGANETVVVKRVDLKGVISEGSADVTLEPFDVVYVPATFIAKADLFVQQYIRDLLPIATTVNFSYILGNTGVAVVPR